MAAQSDNTLTEQGKIVHVIVMKIRKACHYKSIETKRQTKGIHVFRDENQKQAKILKPLLTQRGLTESQFSPAPQYYKGFFFKRFGSALCCLMTPGLSKNMRCYGWPNFFKLANNQIRHQATYEVVFFNRLLKTSVFEHQTPENSHPCILISMKPPNSWAFAKSCLAVFTFHKLHACQLRYCRFL